MNNRFRLSSLAPIVAVLVVIAMLAVWLIRDSEDPPGRPSRDAAVPGASEPRAPEPGETSSARRLLEAPSTDARALPGEEPSVEPSAAGYGLTGRIVYEAAGEEPELHVDLPEIELLLSLNDGTELRTTTAADGSFELEHRSPARGYLRLASERYTLADGTGEELEVRLPAAGLIVPVRLRAVTGRIVWADGRGAAGARARLGIEGKDAHAMADDDGHFRVQLPLPGECFVQTLRVAAPDAVASRIVVLRRTVQAGEDLGEISLAPVHSVAVRVTNEATALPIAGAKVTYEDGVGNVLSSELTDSSGDTELLVADTASQLTAVASGFWPRTRETSSDQTFHELALTPAAVLEVTWTGPAEVRKVEIHGRAAEADRAELDFHAPGEAQVVRESMRPDDTVALLLLPREEGRLIVSEGRRLSLRHPLTIQLLGSHGFVLLEEEHPGVAGSESRAVVELRVSALSGVLSGQVVWQGDGSPAAGADVRLRPAGSRTGGQMTVGEDGRFSWEALPEGEYNLRARLDGRSTEREVVVPSRGVRLELRR